MQPNTATAPEQGNQEKSTAAARPFTITTWKVYIFQVFYFLPAYLLLLTLLGKTSII